MMVTNQYCLIFPYICYLFLINKTFTFSKSICMDGRKNATKRNKTSSEFLQPLLSCFQQNMGGSNTVLQNLTAKRVPALLQNFFAYKVGAIWGCFAGRSATLNSHPQGLKMVSLL